jgi:hypothetical protein
MHIGQTTNTTRNERKLDRSTGDTIATPYHFKVDGKLIEFWDETEIDPDDYFEMVKEDLRDLRFDAEWVREYVGDCRLTVYEYHHEGRRALAVAHQFGAEMFGIAADEGELVEIGDEREMDPEDYREMVEWSLCDFGFAPAWASRAVGDDLPSVNEHHRMGHFAIAVAHQIAANMLEIHEE